jgi:predicted lipoprotein with Yx(FWY)xxD motif
LVVALAALSACDTTTGLATPTPAATADLPPIHVNGLFAVESVTLGPIVIDGQGFVVYRSDKDTAHPTTSTCLGKCTKDWIPLRATADLRVTGIDRQLIGSYKRPDGILQLTLAGWPLYGYAVDRMPGDTVGQGVDGVWFVTTPDGGRAGHLLPSPAS